MVSTSNEYLVCFCDWKRQKRRTSHTYFSQMCAFDSILEVSPLWCWSTIWQWKKTGMTFCKVQDDRSAMICVTVPLYHITFSHPCVTMLSLFWWRVYTLRFGQRECILWSQRVHFVVITESAFCGGHREHTLWWSQRVHFVVITENTPCDERVHFVVITECILWWSQREHCADHRECILWWLQSVHFVVITESTFCGDHREQTLWWSQSTFCGNQRVCTL